MKKKSSKTISILLSALITVSCATTNQTTKIENSDNTIENKVTESSIKLLFAGDVMAHEENFIPGKFDRIWKYVSPKIQEADLAFCNLESPVMDTKGWRA